MTRLQVMFTTSALLTLTSCASTAPLGWLNDDHAYAISQDLAVAVSERWPPTNAAVYVGEMPLRDHFEQTIRGHGYAITGEPDGAVHITGLSERLPPNTWHIGLTVDDDVHIHRLYRIDRDDIHALSSVSVADIPSMEDDTVLTPNPQWHLRSRPVPPQSLPAALVIPEPVADPDDPIATTGTFLPVDHTTAPVPVASNASDCPSTDGAVFTFFPGSLKSNLESSLKRCSWTIASWPTDATDPQVIVDWIVSAETRLNAASIEDLLLGLQASYGLESTVNRNSRQISFSMTFGK